MYIIYISYMYMIYIYIIYIWWHEIHDFFMVHRTVLFYQSHNPPNGIMVPKKNRKALLHHLKGEGEPWKALVHHLGPPKNTWSTGSLSQVRDGRWKIELFEATISQWFGGQNNIHHVTIHHDSSLVFPQQETQDFLQRSLHWWQFNRDNHDNPWLVVDLPLWKILVRPLGLLFPIYGKIKNVPNHQPDPVNLI